MNKAMGVLPCVYCKKYRNFMNRSIFLWNIILIHQNALLLFNWHQTREVITDHLMEISTK